MKAKYMALSDAACEKLGHHTFFKILSIELPPPVLYTVNEATEAIVSPSSLNIKNQYRRPISLPPTSLRKGSFNI